MVAHHRGQGLAAARRATASADDPVRGVSSVGGSDGYVTPVGVAVAPLGEQGVGVETGSFE